MIKNLLTPDYIFEASWEVCNKVGGIYTVLSSRAKTLQDKFHDRILFIGPDLWKGKKNIYFTEDDRLYAAWKAHACHEEGLGVRVGRWNVPGTPIAILVDFQRYYNEKNEIYAAMWRDYGVDSLHAYGDYDESSMFAIAAGKVAESYYRFNLTAKDKVVFQAHEWMTGMGALYLKKHVPEIATLFTTHATSIGRSIACNNKPLYEYFEAYNGDQMAEELNMQSKHSIEKQTAHHVDCFTTVSEITNRECRQLLEKPADVVLMNGFEDDFVPKGTDFTRKRKEARAALLNVANKLMGTTLKDDTLIVGTSGRYEFKNKGLDVFIESLGRLNRSNDLQQTVLAFIEVPAWVEETRKDLQERIDSTETFDTPLYCPFITHWLHNMEHDQVLGMLRRLGLTNRAEDKVKVIFVPCYLNGQDGIFNKSYYDLLLGQDLSVYASYYEPWGYTPLESIAFKVPTITTDLAGFGLWVNSSSPHANISEGVEVLHRSDSNYTEVAEGIEKAVIAFSCKSSSERTAIRRKASAIAVQALWKHFIQYYYKAYDVALHNATERQRKENK